PEYTGKGLGKILYSVLLERIQAAGKRNVIAVITLPNPASIALHEKLGFIKTAHFPEVGFKFNRWLDVGYWQLSFSMDPDQSSPLDEKPTS
ncbi:MAG TPA: N-acetyltransferase family protein, partial [Anaerolineaceae bacterium]|nr:N-acetyltransferase family protein [Anaerolineaceae bacterium]